MSGRRHSVVIEDRIPEPIIRSTVRVYPGVASGIPVRRRFYEALRHPRRSEEALQLLRRSRRYSSSEGSRLSSLSPPAPPPLHRTQTQRISQVHHPPPPAPEVPRTFNYIYTMSPGPNERRQGNYVPLPPPLPPLRDENIHVEDRAPEGAGHPRAGSYSPHRPGSRRRYHRQDPYEMGEVVLDVDTPPHPEARHFGYEETNAPVRSRRNREQRLSDTLARTSRDLSDANIHVEALQRQVAALTQQRQVEALRADRKQEKIDELQARLELTEREIRLAIRERNFSEALARLERLDVSGNNRAPPDGRSPTTRPRTVQVVDARARPHGLNTNEETDRGVSVIREAQRDRQNVERGP